MTDSTAIQLRESDRANLSDQVAAFLAAGKHITRLEHTERAPLPQTAWNSSMGRRERSRRTYEERIAKIGNYIAQVHKTAKGQLRCSTEVRRLCRAQGYTVNTPEVEQIAARFGIELLSEWRNRP